MTDEDERERIRQRKREQLRQRHESGGDSDGSATSPSEPVHVESADQFEELVASRDPVLVDFRADWCGPCKMLDPVVATIAADTGATVAKVDVDQHQDLASRANVRGVPTLVLYSEGDPVQRLVGVQEESKLRDLIERHSS